MAAPDRRGIELAGGADAPIVIIPTAAFPDNNHLRAGGNGRRWFTSLGATDVQTAPLLDRDSAADPEVMHTLAEARLIYLLGGFPGYLCQTLQDTPAWTAMRTAYANGAVAGRQQRRRDGPVRASPRPARPAGHTRTGADSQCVCAAHHNNFGQGWAERLRALLPQATLVGIDECTGMINDQLGRAWSVHGAGAVTLYRPGQPLSSPQVYRPGEPFSLP